MVEGTVVNRDYKKGSMLTNAINPLTRELVAGKIDKTTLGNQNQENISNTIAEVVYKNSLGNCNLVENFVH